MLATWQQLNQGPLESFLLQKTKIILWVSLSLIFLDQITKIWVVENICYRGDDVCQEADGSFRVVDYAPSSGSEGEIGDIRLEVEMDLNLRRASAVEKKGAGGAEAESRI